ncbi:hypothetical protein OKW41_004666 [Paraburkholderia sp. UCT70]|uniref:hypothetical protein n=1 Tax=Paraburkholderia sp. UCT70 TaxID=2991068 RepID=UPI003D1CB756
MFTPEFSATDAAEHILLANHYLETEEALNLSIAFVRGRIHFGRQHVPLPATFVVHYDVRGEPARDFRRLHFLRKWSYGKHQEEVPKVLAGSS